MLPAVLRKSIHPYLGLIAEALCLYEMRIQMHELSLTKREY